MGSSPPRTVSTPPGPRSCGQARAILACDLFTTTTLTGVTYHVFAVIEHTGRRVPILGATAHPTGAWVTQLARNLVMDLQDAGADTKYLIRDRDARFTQAFDAVLIGEGIEILKCAARTPRMKLDHGEVGTDLPARAPGPHSDLEPRPPPRVPPGEFEAFHNEHRPHRAPHGAAPLRPRPQPITNPPGSTTSTSGDKTA
jgi:putative transposase